MIKFIIRSIFILLSACLLLSSSMLFAQQETVSNPEGENAAVYYNKAFELLKFPDYESEFYQKVIEIVKNGLKAKNKELEDILTVNAPALKKFYKGLSLDKCDFTYINPDYNNPASKPIPNFLRCRHMVYLLILRARKFEYEGQFDKALDIYFDIMRFSRHISQGERLFAVTLSSAIDILAYIPLSQYLAQPDIKKEDCQKILKFIREIEPKIITPKQAIEFDKKCALLLFEYLADEEIKKSQQLLDKGDITQDRFNEIRSYFKDRLIPQEKNLTNKYYDLFIKAAEGNFAVDWARFNSELVSLLDSVRDELNVDEDEDIMTAAYSRFNLFYKLKSFIVDQDTQADMTARLMLAMFLPYSANAPHNMYISETMFRLIKTATALRLYYLEKDVIPEDMFDFALVYCDKLPKDPYSNLTLRYKTEGNEFIIWGVGKDRMNNNGVGKFNSKGEDGEDIVLRGRFNAD